MNQTQRAEWLADKLHNGGDYGKEAAALLVTQAREIERLKAHAVTLAETARQVERERCAALAEEYATWGGSNFRAWFLKLARAIRAGDAA